jgi:hypothetical protein
MHAFIRMGNAELTLHNRDTALTASPFAVAGGFQADIRLTGDIEKIHPDLGSYRFIVGKEDDVGVGH